MGDVLRALHFLVLVSLMLLAAVLLTLPAKADAIKVMVIDTGVVVSHPALRKWNPQSFTADDTKFDNIHGTAISSLVMNGILDEGGAAQTPVCNQTHLYVCNYKPFKAGENMINCLDKAIMMKMDFVNFSSTGDTFLPQEYGRIAILSNNGTKFVTATGNEGTDLRERNKFPAMYASMQLTKSPFNKLRSLENVIPVGALTSSNQRWDMSNYGIPVKMEPGVNIRTAFVIGFGEVVVDYGTAMVTGTSASTALYTNKLIRQKCQDAK